MPQYELKRREGKPVVWEGTTSEDAAWGYVAHMLSQGRRVAVIATRQHPRYGVLPAPERNLGEFIIEPGHRLWGKPHDAAHGPDGREECGSDDGH